nr:immunoglobulin light chain junction region [Macaca mulatta]
CQQDYRYPWTF